MQCSTKYWRWSICVITFTGRLRVKNALFAMIGVMVFVVDRPWAVSEAQSGDPVI
jgi:hypothetical protein